MGSIQDFTFAFMDPKKNRSSSSSLDSDAIESSEFQLRREKAIRTSAACKPVQRRLRDNDVVA
jgi:hypothetical protein